MDIKELLDVIAKEKASDLIITAGAPPTLRVDGELRPVPRHKDMTPEQTRTLIYGFLSAEQQKSFEEKKELDFSLAAGPKRRFRVNVYLQKQAVSAALRPIPENVPSLKELGLPEDIEKLALMKQGLVLVTGPTGQGKTTTLAAIVDLINRSRACHIITIEDPVEYVHYHDKSIVDQREVGGDTLTFPNALKYVLRQSPDVIMIGEMRDLETIQAALRAAETGHLVFATLHTNDAAQTVDRIVDVFPGDQQQQIRFQLSMTLLAVLSQRLLPREDGKGRVLAYELMKNNTAVSHLIREGKTHQVYSIIETSTQDGMMTLDRCVKNLYLEGIITHDDAVALVRDPTTISA
ncbi:MAG: type IV pilus twitching motility protein PilT [Candidatus Hydrogenedentes bacterium]|nr:type IV pilus twitching motility protein PilT [Candidatus Hydrogenedentota bacterium]